MLEKFNESVLNGTGKIIVAFKAPWCAPCKALTPILEQIKTEGYHVFEVNTDEEEDLTMKYNIRGVPTTMVFKDGVAIQTFSGYQTKETLLNVLRG